MSSAEHGALLPNGMMDRLPDVAEHETEIIHTLLQSFGQFGYRQVNPPLVEFEESLMAESSGQALSKNTFRMMDPVSRRMMAIRSDTTAQIIRIAASRLKTSPRPLRLSYVADVLRVKASQLRPERQVRQVGCELLGLATEGASAETALLAVYALHRIGVKKISIDFTAPEIIRALSETLDDPEEFVQVCQRRDDDALKKFGESGKILIKLNQASGEDKDFFAQIKKITLPPALKKSFARLQQVISEFREGLQAYGLENVITITIDPLETRDFEYQTLPSFTLFARGVRGELGRGGFYEAGFQLGPKKKHQEPANGFTLYMDSVLRALPAAAAVQRVYVPAGTAWQDIKTCQDQGYMVVKGASAKASAQDLAALACTHVYKSGKIVKL